MSSQLAAAPARAARPRKQNWERQEIHRSPLLISTAQLRGKHLCQRIDMMPKTVSAGTSLAVRSCLASAALLIGSSAGFLAMAAPLICIYLFLSPDGRERY
jgi:hypothetical protein